MKYPDHNLVRTRAQYRLLECFDACFEDMQAMV